MAIEVPQLLSVADADIDQFRNAWPEVEVTLVLLLLCPRPRWPWRAGSGRSLRSRRSTACSLCRYITYEAVLAISNQHSLVSHSFISNLPISR